ncbi:MAG: DUF5606 domain-containing protein [Saprospiraceae bacterium]
MNLENLVAVSGLPGIYRVLGSRSNGLIIEDMQQQKKQFVSMRSHQFSALESIAIYTESESSPLKDIFQSILDHLEATPLPDLNGPVDQLKKYFAVILPEYDRDRVYVNDIKKVLKWFSYLHSINHFTAEEATTELPAAEVVDKSEEE